MDGKTVDKGSSGECHRLYNERLVKGVRIVLFFRFQ